MKSLLGFVIGALCLVVFQLNQISNRLTQISKKLDAPISVSTPTSRPPSAREIASAIAIEMGAPTHFSFRFINWDLHHASFRLQQSGPPASDISPSSEPPVRAMLTGDSLTFEPVSGQLPKDSQWTFMLSYTDPHGERHTRSFKAVPAPQPMFFEVAEIKP